MPPVIVFDGDDTLWWTEPLYDIARDLAGDVAAADGLDAEEFDRVQKEIDVANFPAYGLTRERFPTSSVQAYDRLCAENRRKVNPVARQAVWYAADTVFTSSAEVHGHADDVLETLRWDGYRLVLYTKGDEEVQKKRIRDSGLAHHFTEVVICDHKKAEDFREVVQRNDGWCTHPTSRAISIGNSYKSDIAPALEIGMWGVWIEAYTWKHEHHERAEDHGHPKLIEAFGLHEVPGIIANGALWDYSNV